MCRGGVHRTYALQPKTHTSFHTQSSKSITNCSSSFSLSKRVWVCGPEARTVEHPRTPSRIDEDCKGEGKQTSTHTHAHEAEIKECEAFGRRKEA